VACRGTFVPPGIYLSGVPCGNARGWPIVHWFEMNGRRLLVGCATAIRNPATPESRG
jgi:hypothetical protein